MDGREKGKKKVKEQRLISSKLSKSPSRELKQSSNKVGVSWVQRSRDAEKQEIFRFPSHLDLLVGPWLIQMYQSSATLFLGFEISSRDVEDVKTLKPVTVRLRFFPAGESSDPCCRQLYLAVTLC